MQNTGVRAGKVLGDKLAQDTSIFSSKSNIYRLPVYFNHHVGHRVVKNIRCIMLPCKLNQLQLIFQE